MPSHFESVTTTVQVTVDGAPLASDVLSYFVEWTVDDSINVPDMVELRFTDDASHIAMAKGGFKIGSKVKLSLSYGGSTAPTPLFDGEITALESQREHGESGQVIVRGYDLSHRLFRGRRVATFTNMTPGDVARKVAQQAGLTVGTVDSGGPTYKYLAQEGISDWDFLARLARINGFEATVADGKFNFRNRTESSQGPATSQTGADNPLVLDALTTLLSYRTTVTAADQVPQVVVRGWDPAAKQKVVATEQAGTPSAQVDGYDPAKLAGVFGAPPWLESVPACNQQAQAASIAAALADRLSGSFAEIDAVARGNPNLRSGAAVGLTNLGQPFDGKYTISQAKHVFTVERGYLTYLSVSNVSDRDIYGLTSAGAGATPRFPGVINALVTDIKDEDSQFRVKVMFPTLDDQLSSTWARMVTPAAGNKHGFVVLPEVGDEVLVAFGMGDFQEPYVLGGLYNGKDLPDKAQSVHVDSSAGKVSRRSWTSRTGMVFEYIETSSEEKLTLSTTGGAQRITLTQNQAKGIEILSEGAITVKAKQDVTIESPQGNISMKAMGITIEATNALELKGATAKMSGQATAELSASGQTTVKGSMVMIN